MDDMVDEPLGLGMFDEPESTPERKERPPASISSFAFRAPTPTFAFNSNTLAVQPPQQVRHSNVKPKPSAEEVALMQAFSAKFAKAKLPDQNGESSRSRKMTTQDMFSNLNAEIQRAPAVASSSSRRARVAHPSPSLRGISPEDLDDEHLENLLLSPTPETEGADYDNVSDDEDWDKISISDALFPDDNTAVGGTIPTVVYQSPSFSGAWAEFTERYALSPEARHNLQGAMAMLKWAGEFGYAVVSEPVMDAAEWVVQKQFGCRMEELPEELRLRLLASLPDNVQNALRVANSVAGRSAGAVATSYKMLSEARGKLGRQVMSSGASGRGIAGEQGEEEDCVAQARTTGMIGIIDDQDDDSDVELIDELEGMTMGTA